MKARFVFSKVLILKSYNTVPHIQCKLLAKQLSNDLYFEKNHTQNLILQ